MGGIKAKLKYLANSFKIIENGDHVVANWVWEQAQKAWVQE